MNKKKVPDATVGLSSDSCIRYFSVQSILLEINMVNGIVIMLRLIINVHKSFKFFNRKRVTDEKTLTSLAIVFS